MRFKLDENLPEEICELLFSFGFDTESVRQEKLSGHPDTDIADTCKREQRVLLTLDTDFANILAYPPEQYPGIIVIRSKVHSKPVLMATAQRIARALKTRAIRRELWIVEPDRIRSRGCE